MTDDEFVTTLIRAICMILSAINKRYGRNYRIEK
jgi:hypothetical protein